MWLLPQSLLVLIGAQLGGIVQSCGAAPAPPPYDAHAAFQVVEKNLPSSYTPEGKDIVDLPESQCVEPCVRAVAATLTEWTTVPTKTIQGVYMSSDHGQHQIDRRYYTPTYAYPTYSYPTYSFPTYSYPTYSFPTYSYPTDYFPTYSYPTDYYPTDYYPTDYYPTDYYPTYPYPTYPYPTYSYPTYSFPTYSYPFPTDDSGGDSSFGGGGGGVNFELPKMKKTSVKTIVGAVVGSVSGFLAFLGGIWAWMKRRARRAAGLDNHTTAAHATSSAAAMMGPAGSGDVQYTAEQQVPFISGHASAPSYGAHGSQMSSASGSVPSSLPSLHTHQASHAQGPYVPTQF